MFLSDTVIVNCRDRLEEADIENIGQVLNYNMEMGQKEFPVIAFVLRDSRLKIAKDYLASVLAPRPGKQDDARAALSRVQTVLCLLCLLCHAIRGVE